MPNPKPNDNDDNNNKLSTSEQPLHKRTDWSETETVKFGEGDRTLFLPQKNLRKIQDGIRGDLKIEVIAEDKPQANYRVFEEETVKNTSEEILSRFDDNNSNNNNNNSNNEDSFYETVRTKKKGRSVTIIGDSVLKDIQPHKMKSKLQGVKLYVKSFSGATIADMADYVRPTMRYAPNLIVMHAGTNDLRTEKSAKNIASDIMELTMNMKGANNDVMVSGLIARGDELNAKALEVNEYLEDECKRHNIYMIDNSNILINKHLNGSGLHLNSRGTVQIAHNFIDSIKY